MKKIVEVITVLIIGISVFCLGFNYKNNDVPKIHYQVYPNGQKLGAITSKTELEKYIDSQNEQYKKKLNVKKIYAPTGLEIKKIETYEDEVKTAEEIYKMLSDKDAFTVKGYQFTIKKEDSKENVKIYTLDKETFDIAVENTIKTFAGEDDYKSYNSKEKVIITETGKIVENIYIDEDITVKNVNIPVTKKIYLDSKSLSKFLVFGTEDEQKKYTVKEGDTIDDVAYNNQINVEEFLISNPNFTSSKNLLFPGQEVTIGITNPQISVVKEEYVVKDQEISFQTEIQYDKTKVIGEEEVTQDGENGLERITQRIKYVSGDINYVDPINKEELKPTINKIVVKGDKYVPNVGSTTNWLWPSNSGYTISSDYIYRINPVTGAREHHGAIDISGTGYGSPIYAVTNGVVSESSYRYQDGNYVCINHNNGYYTCYAHMAKRNVDEGQTVARGQVIGYVGQSGYATGPHLHFEVWIGGKPWNGGTRINPWLMY